MASTKRTCQRRSQLRITEEELLKPPKFTWGAVKRLCMMQCTGTEIANYFEIPKSTLTRWCRDEFGVNAEEKFAQWREGIGKQSLRRKQWMLADTSATMAIFLGKQYLQQTDDYQLSHSGEVTQIVHFGDGEAKPWESEDASSLEEEDEDW